MFARIVIRTGCADKARGEIWTVEPVIFRVARIIERLSELGLGLSVEQSLRDDVNGRRQGR